MAKRNYEPVDDVDEEQSITGTDRICDNSSINRRNFMHLSAATAGAFTFSGTVLGKHTSEKTTELYGFIRNQTDADYEIPTLISLSDSSGFDQLEAITLEAEDSEYDFDFERTTEPDVAAYVQLPNVWVDSVLEIEQVEQLEYSPGSNPFWMLDYYPDGVFPAPSESVDFISYGQMVDGLSHLAEQHPDRLTFESIGKSPGYHNLLEGEIDPQTMWIAELTNDINNEESFKKKEKVVFSLSIHGDERAGVESGSRLIERVLEGEEEDLETVLDEVVIIFIFTNPDGWVKRQPQYIGQNNEFARENGASIDLNRAFPTVGWIDPTHYPSEPFGANQMDDQPGIDGDVPEEIVEHVSDGLSVAERLRTYENLNSFVDMHEKGWSDNFIEPLTQNSEQFDHGQLHDLNGMMRTIGEYIADEVGSFEDNLEALRRGIETLDGDETPDLPERLYAYGSSVDGLEYTTTGGLRSWIGGPEEYNNLDTKGITIEISGPGEFDQAFVDLQTNAYMATIRAVTTYATATVEATIETNGQSTAYVTTDALTRSSDTLELVPTELVQTRVAATVAAGGSEELTFPVSENTLEIRGSAAAPDDIDATLVDPDDEPVDSFKSTGEADWETMDPTAGEWTLIVENPSQEEITVTLSVEALEALEDDVPEDATPDPRAVLGFEQLEYTATPLQYFEDYHEYLNGAGNSSSKSADPGSIKPVSVNDVSEGVLFDGDSLAYENLVVVHNEMADESDYIEALDEFVDAGGNLVLTDRGVSLLPKLETDLACGITEDAVANKTPQFAAFDDDEEGKALDHPLMTAVRPHQRELWNVPGLGYTNASYGEAPVTSIDTEAFRNAGGTVAGRINDRVAVGTLGEVGAGIQVLASCLPPATQEHLHPWGLLDYGVEFLAHTIMINALNYEQHRFVDDERITRWREAPQYW